LTLHDADSISTATVIHGGLRDANSSTFTHASMVDKPTFMI